jgi:hypothetical protein
LYPFTILHLASFVADMADKPAEANDANLLEVLQELYWKAAKREVCSMILFFGDVLHQGRKLENFLNVDAADLESENFKKMFDLWRE